MTTDYDLIIVGGGIAGSALATVMARAGKRVLLLEKSSVYEDRVRGEWIAPWGVAETRRLGLCDLLVGAGGHHVTHHITYDESRPAAEAEASALPLSMFLPDVIGPLCIGHPHHCQTLFDAAGKAGAETHRGVETGDIVFAPTPSVTWTKDGQAHTHTGSLIVGADGRTSGVRESAGIALHQDPPHHMFAGMLVEGADGWDASVQAIGTEGDFGFLAFPQGDGRVRVYGSFSLDQRRRFAGPDGQRRFLDAFAMQCAPANRALVEGRPAGPLLAYLNNDSWTDEPFAQGVVLCGDAAGWNDPIIGLGLSIAYRDVRIVSDLLKSSDDWSPALFASYAEERAERMRRLRFAAALTAALDCEFGEGPKARRHRYHALQKADPMIGAHAFAVMAGPESLPPDIFTPEHRAKVLGDP
ncbi:MAG: monooxygenase FAD-binding [Caulobacter sp.]|nr:monooxygenase FAD-binding [Caulobacter sp.]